MRGDVVVLSSLARRIRSQRGVSIGRPFALVLRLAALAVMIVAFALRPAASLADSGTLDCNNLPGGLQYILNSAPAGSSFNVSGTCVGNFVISKSLTLQGGTYEPPIASTGPVFTVDPGSGANVDLSQVIIENGRGNHGADGSATGASATNGGPGGTGGLAIQSGTVSLEYSTVTNNIGGNGGNGGSDFADANGGSGGPGGTGGIAISGGTVTLTSDEISRNSGGGGGNGMEASFAGGGGNSAGTGGVQVNGGTVTLDRVRITANNTSYRPSYLTGGQGAYGADTGYSGGSGSVGGLNVGAGTVNVVNSTIDSNDGSNGGSGGSAMDHGVGGAGGDGGDGGFRLTGGTLSFYNSTVAGNVGGSFGAGGGCWDCGLQPVNGVDGSGAGSALTGSLSLTYTTVSENRAADDTTGATDGVSNRGGLVSAFASILDGRGPHWINPPPDYPCSGTITDNGYNVLPTSGCTIAAGSAGGSTQTSTGLGSLTTSTAHLPVFPESSSSPSIGLVPASVCANGISGPPGYPVIAHDERGIGRYGPCDAGSFQTLRAPTVHLASSDDTGVSNTDGITSDDQPSFTVSRLTSGDLPVTVYVDGQELGTTTSLSGTSGILFHSPTVIADGEHTVIATVTDPDSGIVSRSTGSQFVVNTAPQEISLTRTSTSASIDDGGTYNLDTGSTTLGVQLSITSPYASTWDPNEDGTVNASCNDGTNPLFSSSYTTPRAIITQTFNLTVGTHTISCTATSISSVQSTFSRTVIVKYLSSTSVTSSLSPSTYGDTVTFTATVTGGSGTPAGTVGFTENGRGIPGCGAQTLNSSGVTTCSTSSLNVGDNQQITATYSGGGGLGSSSGSVDQTVHLPNAVPGTVTTCSGSASTQGSLPYELANGATQLTFATGLDCPSSNPISISSTLNISIPVSIDATGHTIVLDGGTGTELFNVDNSAFALPHLVLTGITLSHGAPAIDSNNATVDIANSTLSHNTATGANSMSGAVYSYGTLNITNSTFSDNKPAIVNLYQLKVTNSTFAGNTGPAIRNAFMSTSMKIGGDIFANNTGGNCTKDQGVTLQATDYGYNLDTDGSCLNSGTGDITGQAPLLGSLTNNGGGTETMVPSFTSPAVDGISTSYPIPFEVFHAPLCATTDQRGDTRPDSGESTCDIGAYEVQKAAASLSDVSGSGTYGDTATLTATLKDANGSLLSGEAVAFSVNGTAVCGGATGVACPTTDASGVATLSNVSLSGINGGTWAGAISARFYSDTTHGSTGPTTGPLTVSRADQTLLVSQAVPATAASGAVLYPLAAASSDLDVTYGASGGCSHPAPPQGANVIDIDDATIPCIVTFDQPGNFNYNPAPQVVEVVNEQSQTINLTLPAGFHKSYGDDPFDMGAYATASSGLPVSFSTATTSVCTVSDGMVTMLARGTCTINADQAGDLGYSAAPRVQMTFGVGQKLIMVTASSPASQTYGTTSAPSIDCTADGFVGGDTFVTAPGGTVYDSTGASVAIGSSSPVGDYETQCSGGVVGSNYTIAYLRGSFSIVRAPLSITAGDGSMTYGGTVPVITPSYDGFVNGDGASTLTTAPTCSTTATSSSPVGSYPSTCSGAVAGNYTITYQPGTVHVTPASAGIALDASALNPTYDGTAKAVGATTNPSGLSYSVTYTGTNGTTYGQSTTAPSSPGTYSVTATVTDPNYSGSDTRILTINQAASTTSITSSANPSVFGQPITFTATVTRNGGGYGTPTGNVTFKDGSTTLGTGTLSGVGGANIATLTIPSTSPLAVAAHSVTAVYGGDTYFTGSTSSTLGQTVNKAATTTGVSSSANPSILNGNVTFTATVSVTGPGTGMPAGSVTFKDGSTTLGSASLNSSGVATFSTSSLPVGAHSISASYGGSTSYTSSANSTLTQNVQYTVNVLTTSALTIALQLWDANNANVSASTLKVVAECVVAHGTTPATTCGSSPVQSIKSGNGTFGFNKSWQNNGPSYLYTVTPKGLTRGQQYDLLIQTAGDPLWHAVPFTY